MSQVRRVSRVTPGFAFAASGCDDSLAPSARGRGAGAGGGDLEVWDRAIAVNLRGGYLVTDAAVPHLEKTRGSIVLMSSTAGQRGEAGHSAYAATKFAVKGLTEALSVEFARHGVRVADVLPGLIDTNILRATPNRSGDAPKPSVLAPLAIGAALGIGAGVGTVALVRRAGGKLARVLALGLVLALLAPSVGALVGTVALPSPGRAVVRATRWGRTSPGSGLRCRWPSARLPPGQGTGRSSGRRH